MCSWFVDINDGVSKDCFRVCPAFLGLANTLRALQFQCDRDFIPEHM